MYRQIILSTLVGIVIGSLVTSFYKNSKHNSQYIALNEAVIVSAQTANQCLDGYNKWNDQKQELFTLATSYEVTTNSKEKEKISETLVNKIKEIN